MQMRDLFKMRAHLGWAHVLLSRARRLAGPNACKIQQILDCAIKRMDEHTQRRATLFDAKYGTETLGRRWVKTSHDANDAPVWGYSAVNQDFFREIMRSIPQPLSRYAFVDIGSGKGAAVLMASEFGFRRLVGVELTGELVDIARRNTDIFNRKTGGTVAPDWVHMDFFKWQIPSEPQLFFFNNPFPQALTVEALAALERSLSLQPHPALLVFRKAPSAAGDYLDKSRFWKPVRLAPYWRVYSKE
jgi:SAM-dependent methyltransferase